MEIFWLIVGTLPMLYLMAVCAWRGLAELGWLPGALALRCPARQKPFSPREESPGVAELALFAALALAVQLALIALGWNAAGRWGGFFDAFWSRFTTAGDAEHYLYLAEFGYARTGEMMNRIVFYPLYPLAIRVLALFTGSYPLAAVLISQCCWALAAAMLRRLAARLTSDVAAARCATLAMLVFPFSFFSMGVFTESLFLLLTITALDAQLAGSDRRTAVAGFLAALCRTQGLLLVLPGVFLWLARGPRRDRLGGLAAAVTPMAGFGLYLWLNRLYCGGWFAFSAYQAAPPWYQTAQWVGKTVAQQWSMAQAYPGLANFIYWPQLVLYFVGLALLVRGLHRGMPLALVLYGGGYLGMSYLSSWLISGSRYWFGCAAMYLVLPYLKSRFSRYAILAAEVLACFWYFTFYMQGQAIM